MRSLALFCVLLLPCTVALAQEAPTAPAGEEEAGEDLNQVLAGHIQRGDALLQGGHPGEAAHEYQQAYELDAQPGLLFKLAGAQERAGQLKEAVRSYDQFVHEAPQAPQRPEAEQRMKALYRRIQATADRAGERKKPLWQRPWLWAVVGGAVVVVGVGLGVGLAFGLRNNNAINQ